MVKYYQRGYAGIPREREKERRSVMSDYKNLYFPLFYEWIKSAEPISDEDFGRIVRTVSRSLQGEDAVSELPSELRAICNFMINGAQRVFENSQAQSQTRTRNKKGARQESDERRTYIDSAFERALERSYGKNG